MKWDHDWYNLHPCGGADVTELSHSFVGDTCEDCGFRDEERCGATIETGFGERACELEYGHDGPHQDSRGLGYTWEEENDDDDTSDLLEPDTVWEARGEK